MIPFLLIIFLLALGIQLFYIIFVLAKINKYPNLEEEPPAKLPAVSIIVCSWNELSNLQELIPLLNSQNYPTFEVIIVDDRSHDGTYDYLLTESHCFEKVRFLRIEHPPEHLSPKKYALTLGIKSAKYEVILLTDADCRPQSALWIQGMAQLLNAQKDIVLGFSPYFSSKGFLNKLIRYETFLTALQYFSFALYGMPYMGVGRNLMYRKSLFFNNRGFAKHTNILGGDDDLFMNEVANVHNTAVCLEPETFMYSIPKETWQDWYRQKTRHISVSKYYKKENKIALGLLASSQILFWLSLIALIPFVFFDLLKYWIIGLFLLRLIVHWVVLASANKLLDRTISTISIPCWDFLITGYYLWMGLNNIVVPKRRKMRWK